MIATRCALSLVLILALSSASVSCGGSKKTSGGAKRDPDVVRYLLPLRENPVDSSAAFRCYGACQPEESPASYLGCLQQCDGFQTTPGITCADYEVPPYAACLTARRLRPKDEVPPGWIAVGMVAGIAVMVTASSLCASTQNCNTWGYAAPRGTPGSPW